MKKTWPLLLLGLTACAGLRIEPADDEWDRPQEAMPGIVSGDAGVFRFGSGGEDPAPDPATHSTGDMAEFRQWQQWREAKRRRTAEYEAFRQWLEFQALKSAVPVQPQLQEKSLQGP